MDNFASLRKVIAFLRQLKQEQPSANKADLEKETIRRINPKQERSIFICDGFVLRFSEANVESFSNVVLSLSALQKYDSIPVVSVVVRPDRLEFRLANTTFLRQISHSSHMLRSDNVRGSFLGHDILTSYEGLRNSPEHFKELFAIHRDFTWSSNLTRLVEATSRIPARSTRFEPSNHNIELLWQAPTRAAIALSNPQFRKAEQRLAFLVKENHTKLLQATSLANVNLRGNVIEQLITGQPNAHGLHDLVFDLEPGKLAVDVKTKLLDRASAPKAYNIDKMLRFLVEPDTVFSFFLVGLDAGHKVIRTRLVSIFDPIIIAATRVQTQWAGRNSRGVTQISGNLSRLFASDYKTSVSQESAVTLLEQFVKR